LRTSGKLSLVGDDEYISGRRERQHPIHGLMEKRAFAGQREQMDGPNTRTTQSSSQFKYNSLVILKVALVYIK